MATRGQYRLAFIIDCTLLWGRLGGKYLFVAVVAALILSLIDGVHGWVVSLVLCIGGAVGLIAFFRIRPFLSLGKKGVNIDGRVTDVERREKQSGVSDGGKRVLKRVTYSYEVDGTEFTGRIDWRGSGDFGTLDVGHSIPLVVDPEFPAVALWEKDIPIRMPEIAGL